MFKHLFITLALAAVFTTPACDAPAEDDAEECPAVDGSEPFVVAPRLAFAAPEDAPPPAEYSFREQGPPAGLYTTKLNGQPIKRENVCKLVLSAGALADPNETCTLSWYQPDTSKPDMVLGLGCSMMAPPTLWQHYKTTFESNGATPF